MSELDQREKEVFEAALILPPKERATYLDRAGEGDAQLRQGIVKALFQAQENTAATAQDRPSPSPRKTTVAAFPTETPGEKPGDRTGGYKLLLPCGEDVPRDPSGAGTWHAKVAQKRAPAALNALALTPSASADPDLRDSPRAVTCAENAVAGTNRKDPVILGTLAAAYTEVRGFSQTVTNEEEAIALLRNDESKKDYEARLKLYKSDAPFRDVPK